MLKPTKRNKKQKVNSLNFELNNIIPKTDNQQKVFDLYDEGNHLALIGSAGSGKNYVSIFLGLKDMLENGSFSKIVIIRNIQPVRDVGFLKGSLDEKIQPLSLPYVGIINELFGRDDAFGILTQKNFLEFTSTSYLRGLTFNDTLILVDEVQNLTFHELDTIFSRVGENSRIILCGDFKQSDMDVKREIPGLDQILKIVNKLDNFKIVTFTPNDIVRSGFVKDYIIAKEELGF